MQNTEECICKLDFEGRKHFLPALHYELLLEQLEQQFSLVQNAEDFDVATAAVKQTMTVLASKDVFPDWTAYQGLRLYRWDRESGPLVTLAVWQIFRDRLKAKDDSLLRIKLVEEWHKPGLVPIDPAARFPERAPRFREVNELEARVREVASHLQNIRTGMVYFTIVQEPFFDIENPIVARIFDPEFVAIVKDDIDRHSSIRPVHQRKNTNASE